MAYAFGALGGRRTCKHFQRLSWTSEPSAVLCRFSLIVIGWFLMKREKVAEVDACPQPFALRA